MGDHNQFGKEGEKIAVQFLRDNGYIIKHLNYRYLKAEVDVIAQRKNTLAIIEVKSRSSDALQNIADTVTAKKIKLLVMAADHYVSDNDLDVDVRFDIITILKNEDNLKIEHLTDAFYHF